MTAGAGRTSGERIAEVLREKIEVLTGERGNSRDRALRVRDLDGLLGAVTSISKATGSLSSQIGNTGSTITNIGQSLTALGTLVDGHDEDIEALTVRLTDAENAIAALQASVASLQHKIATAGNVVIPGVVAAPAAGANPTKAEFDALRLDLIGIRNAVGQIVAALD